MFVIPGSSRGRKECGSRPGRRGGGTRARRLASNLARGQGSRRDSRAAVRRQRHPAQGSGVARVAREAGLPPSAVEGIRLALDPGAGRNAVPVRSAILGAAMAMIVMLATATFGSSLATLVSHPALYGWNWTYALASGTPTYIPRARAAALLDHDPAVAASAVRRTRLRIVGTATLPSLGIYNTLHTEMGTGSVLDYRLIPGAVPSQPNDVLVTLRPGADRAVQRRQLERLVPAVNSGQVIPVQRPAEIVNYRSMGDTPAYLGAALAAGAIAALALTLMASVRRRGGRLAVERGRRRRSRGRRAGRHRTGPVSVGLVRSADQRRARANRPRPVGHPYRGRCDPAGQPGRRGPRPRRRAHPHRVATPRRVTR